MSKQSQRRKRAKLIRAAAEAKALIPFDGPITISAAAEGDTPKGPRRFEMLAYNGGELNVDQYPVPVVVDLDGMELRSQQIPTYFGHHRGDEGSKLVGHSDHHDKSGGRLAVSGVVSAATPFASQVTEAHDNGYQWQASVGVAPSRSDLEDIASGRTTTVNGRTFTGPVIVARKSILRHIAILPEGADKDTSLSIAAGAAQPQKESDMEFSKWIEALFGGEVPELTEKQTATLQSRYDAEKKATPVIEGKAADPPAPEFDMRGTVLAYEKHVATVQAAAADYSDKIEASELGKIMTGANKKAAELKALALNEEKAPAWLECQLVKAHADTMVELVRAERPTAPAIHGSNRDIKPDVIEAALCLSAALPKPEEHFKDEVLDAADKNFRNIGVQQLLIQAASSNGYTCRPGERIHNGNIREVLRYACPSQPIQGALFSGLDVSGILSNTGNKMLLAGFNTVPQKWREVAISQTVSDFKEVTRYRMTASLEYEEVPAGGEIKHGTLGEESYTIQAKTYAKMLALTRTDIINDDLGAFDDLRTRLGMGAVLKMNKIFWTLWVNNSTFFTSARGNYQEGAATALGEAGLNTGVKLFRDMEGPDGNLLDMEPDRLIVPSALEATAKKWHTSTEVRDTTASTKTAVNNIHQGKYRPVVVPQLGNSNYTGYSALAWYLLCDPAILATAAMCFLNGQQSPVIESADADFNTLGIQLRGYHDFGVNFTEYRAGVKSKGEA